VIAEQVDHTGEVDLERSVPGGCVHAGE
jgi:hypothetical protein